MRKPGNAHFWGRCVLCCMVAAVRAQHPGQAFVSPSAPALMAASHVLSQLTVLGWGGIGGVRSLLLITSILFWKQICHR